MIVNRRMIPHSFRPLAALVAFILFSCFGAYQFNDQRKQPFVPSQEGAQAGYDDVAVAYIYDGDTIRLDGGEWVRLDGIDTPEASRNKRLFRDVRRSGRDVDEILRMGHVATEYTRSLLEGRRVRLEFDIEKRDKYGRLLAYVYRLDDGLFVNADIIRHGYAYTLTIPPNIRHADEFKALYKEARKTRSGFWGNLDVE